MEHTDVVIIGSGFGGLTAAQKLAKSSKNVTVLTLTDEHVFQPLLYQVATGVLSTDEVAPATSDLLARHPNVAVRSGRVTAIDADEDVVTYLDDAGTEHRLGFGSLIAATGASQSYFGHPEFAEVTFALKTSADAVALRDHIQATVALARDADGERRHALLTFVVVGAGPTGVEVAGQLKELAERFFGHGREAIDPASVRVLLVEGTSEVLPVYGGKLSDYTRAKLESSGVEVLVNSMVTNVTADAVTIAPKGADEFTVAAATTVWAAGMQASDIAEKLAAASGATTDRAGRVEVNADLSVGERRNLFAIGDMASLNNYPAQSPFAMQGARHVSAIVAGKRSPGTPFRYHDKGSMATINRFNAVVQVGPVKITGVLAWLMWLAVHLFYLVGIGNRLATVRAWLRSFVGRRRPGLAVVPLDREPEREIV